MSTLITYQDQIVAPAAARRFYLAQQIEELQDDDPLADFVSLMAAYALRVRDGSAPGPYIDDRAERFARLTLMDEDEFLMLDANGLADELIAGHFGVPVEQVEAMRCDIERCA